MTELEMTTEAEAEVEEFTDELSDEALDRDGVKFCASSLQTRSS
jgi:hypothetical protein